MGDRICGLPYILSLFTEVLMTKFAEMKGLQLSELTFQFDGEKISATDTPSSLDMDDGDCVDVTGY